MALVSLLICSTPLKYFEQNVFPSSSGGFRRLCGQQSVIIFSNGSIEALQGCTDYTAGQETIVQYITDGEMSMCTVRLLKLY